MRQLKIALGSIAFLALLAFIFWGITKLQHAPPVKPVGPSLPPPAQEHVQVPITSAPPEKQEIDVVFLTATESIHFKNVALIEKITTPEQAPQVNIDGTLAMGMIEELKTRVSVSPPEPAKIVTDRAGNPERILRGELGTTIDVEKTLKSLEEHISKNPETRTIDLEVAFKEDDGPEGFPRLREKLGYRVLLASHATDHPGHRDDHNRNINLSLAAAKIDGIILKPGESFGFDQIVGPRSAKNGYRKAGVISQGRVIQGLGGGVCQVSTTLYRAALHANQKILERHNHSIYEGIEYAERGLDSAIAWGSKNLRFQNALDVPVLISCTIGPGTVRVEIFAERKPFRDVVVETRHEKTHPFKVETRKNARLKKGSKKVIQPGVTGYSIESYRLVTTNGTTREERLSQDRYLTFDQIEEVSN